MPGIGDYIHFKTENYKMFGTTKEGPSNFDSAIPSINARIKKMKNLAKSLHSKYDGNSKIADLEKFMNSIFYPGEEGRNETEEQQFQQMRKYVEAEFSQMFDGFGIAWEQGMSVYMKGNKEITKGTHVSTLKKVYNQLNSALDRVKSANTIAKIEAAKKAINDAYDELVKANIGSDSRVSIGKSLDNSGNLIETVNAALRATMYNNAAIGYIFELALAAFSGQVSNSVGQISADLVNKAMQGAARSNPTLRIDLIDKTYFDEELFGREINRGATNLGVWQRTEDGTAFQFTAPTQDKLDVALSFDGEMYNITAKNYANILQRDIHIVSGTSLLSLILDDDVDFINHYLNIIATDKPSDLPAINLTLAHQAMKLTILLKALSGIGTSAEGSTADVLVVNDRASKHIYIRSVGDLVTKIANQLDQIDNYMKIHGLGQSGKLSVSNAYVGDAPSDANAQIRITKLLAQLHNTKIGVSIKGTALTELTKTT